MKKTPLDKWIHKTTGGDIPEYQLKKLCDTLKTAQNGTYYRGLYPEKIADTAMIENLPMIDAKTLQENGSGLVCVTQSDISRIVTLFTSGSTGQPKRVYFTQDDQELTLDYFANGLAGVVAPGGAMAILLPCESPGGVGDLIAQALERIPVKPVRHGPVGSLIDCAAELDNNNTNSIVGAPVQVLALARYCEARGINLNITSVLLCTDSIPRTVRREIGRIWKCEVYEHYGTTEMGLGGAIDCDAHDGYHIRENDLLFEIVDESGKPLPDGSPGEIVFTTLTRRGMPLIRYKTGDISKIIPGKCKCGSLVKRVAPISGRLGGGVTMECGTRLLINDFDETLLGIKEVCDFRLTASPESNILKIDIDTQQSLGHVSSDEIEDVLRGSGLIHGLTTEISVNNHPDTLVSRTGKRVIIKNT